MLTLTSLPLLPPTPPDTAEEKKEEVVERADVSAWGEEVEKKLDVLLPRPGVVSEVKKLRLSMDLVAEEAGDPLLPVSLPSKPRDGTGDWENDVESCISPRDSSVEMIRWLVESTIPLLSSAVVSWKKDTFASSAVLL